MNTNAYLQFKSFINSVNSRKVSVSNCDSYLQRVTVNRASQEAQW